MEQVKLEKYPTIFKLNENDQSLIIKFSLLVSTETGYRQITLPAKCRDYLLDIGWSKMYSQPVNIYGMKYDYSKDPFDEDHLQLSLTFPSKTVMANFLKHLDYIHEKEKVTGVNEFTIVFTTDQDKTLIVVADKKWQSTPWKLSLYTYYLKVMSYPSPDELDYPESKYAQDLTSGIEAKLLSHVTDDFVFYYKDLEYNHSSSGFVSTIINSWPGKNEAHKHIFGGTV